MTIRPFPAARAAGIAASIALVATLPAAPVWAQPNERVLYVSVVDGQGRPADNVTAADLIVREDGVSREVLRVSPATEPMQIAVLVDTSAGLAPDIANVRDALTAFAGKLAPPHELSIVEYGDRPTILADSTSNPALLQKGIGRIFPRKGSGAYVLDAIVETSRGIQKRESPRPVIVAIDTQGVEFSNYGYDRVLDALRASGAALYAITLSQGSDDLRSEEARSRAIVFDRGPRESGGYRDILLSSLGLEQALGKLAEQLLHQVRVVYARPQALIPPTTITVEATRDGMTARGTPVRAAKGA